MSWWRELLALPEQGSTFAAGVDQLHGVILLTTLLGALVVAGVGLVFTIRYRRRRGDPDLPTPHVTTSSGREAAVIVALSLLFVAWWWVGYRQFLAIARPPPQALEVFVTAKQWLWEFAYRDGRASIAVLVVPAGVPVRLVMTSRDVIHGFSVPDFRLKHDVLPGVTTISWFQATPGVHPLFCTQYCGLDHSRMLGAVVALDAVDYARWRDGEVPAPVAEAESEVRDLGPPAAVPRGLPPDDLPAQGLAVAARHGCLACHTTDGQRHLGPTWYGLYQSPVRLDDGRTVIADEAYLTESMMEPAVKIVAGYSASMPSYQGLLEPGETAALLALITSLKAGTPPPQRIPGLPSSAAGPAPQAPPPPGALPSPSSPSPPSSASSLPIAPPAPASLTSVPTAPAPQP